MKKKKKSKPIEFYTYVHNKIKVITTNIGPLHLENGKETNTKSEMAEVLNYYFASVFTVEDTDEIQEITPAKPNLIVLNACDFNEDTVTKALDEIKVNKTLGPDCIVLRVLREATYQVSKHLKSPRHLEISKCYSNTNTRRYITTDNYTQISLTFVVGKLYGNYNV